MPSVAASRRFVRPVRGGSAGGTVARVMAWGVAVMSVGGLALSAPVIWDVPSLGISSG